MPLIITKLGLRYYLMPLLYILSPILTMIDCCSGVLTAGVEDVRHVVMEGGVMFLVPAAFVTAAQVWIVAAGYNVSLWLYS
jgi:hypothetical protein